jgi:PKD repeat protein
MSKNTEKKFVVRSVVAAIALLTGGAASYAVYAENTDVPLASVSEIKAVSKAPSAWGNNPLVVAQATSEVASSTTDSNRLTPSRTTSYAVPFNVDSNSAAASDSVDATASTTPELTPAMMEKMEMASDFVPTSASGSTENAPFSGIKLNAMTSGKDAIAQLGTNLGSVAKWYGMNDKEFRTYLMSDKSIHVDTQGRVLHIDEETVAPGTVDGTMATAAITASVATAGGASPFPFDQTFKLHTKPDSTRVLYLNFTGQGTNPAFDTDKSPATFSNSERLLIQKVVLRVAEAYSGFDVDITTEAPAVPLGKIGATILITPRSAPMGGYAYLNSFSNFASGNAPAFCFPNNLANAEKYIADCVSHELGHTLGLSHQGQLPTTAYYTGQGAGETGWAPIMGVGYYKNLPQWSKGEYFNANNKQDAYAVMFARGLKPRADDHGNTIAFADPLDSKIANGFNNLTGLGRIETTGDVDMFKFVAGAGPVNLKVIGSVLGGTLDIALQLLDVNEQVLATSSTTATTLAKTLVATLPTQGTYFLKVSGAGRGDPLKTGYSNYGSIGEYNISGTSAISTVVPTAAVLTSSAVVAKVSAPIAFDSSTSTPTSGGKITSFTWSFGDGTAAVSGAKATHAFSKAGSYETVLKIVDSLGQVTLKGTKITIS